jgi:outer membrane protein assembly factor BamA
MVSGGEDRPMPVDNLTFLAACVAAAICSTAAPAAAGAPTGCDEKPLRAGGSYAFTSQIDRELTLPDDLVIGEVAITNLQVFDLDNPEENNALYRFANRWHVITKPSRISQKLLFESGEPFEQRLIEESARNLRAEKFLYDADIRPTRVCDGKVDVEVITRDVWSFTPEISYKRSGGDDEYRVGLKDTNLFGTGQQLAVLFKRDIDRDSTQLSYRDRNFRGSRKDLKLSFADNDDGWGQVVRLARPFYSLDTRSAWGIGIEKLKQIDTQYFRTDDVSEVERKAEEYFLQYGWSRGLIDGKTTRWWAGYTYKEESFEPGDELLPPVQFPIDKKLSYPYLAYERVEDNFDTSKNYNQLHRIEDLRLGHRVYVKLGYSSELIGADADRLVFNGKVDGTLSYDGESWLSHKLEWESLYNFDTSEGEDVLVDYEINYFHPQTTHRSFYASLQGTYSHNLNSNKTLYLGGEAGVRAFDNRLQRGDRRVLFTIEERMYTDIHLFNLIRLGWAVFADVGRAWEPDVDDGFSDKYLANYGFGLRLTSSKADAGSVLHVDISFPLTNKDDPDVDSSEISITLKDRF